MGSGNSRRRPSTWRAAGRVAGGLASALVLMASTHATTMAGDRVGETFEAARQSILAADLTWHGSLLSSDELEGREGGSRGEAMAALYIASQYRDLGLLPGGPDGTYFQPFHARGVGDTFNVLGLLPGSDSDLRDEIVVVGGHYDHIGFNRRGEICNGADDNASGSAAVLELVEAFRMVSPRRSILFCAFAAEEKGLLGSKYYCEHPVYPLSQTVAMLNLDMVGRSKDNYLFVGGVGTSPGFRQLIERANEDFGFSLEMKDGGGAPSDNNSFFVKGVPVLFFFTGIHEDYNQPSDDWGSINLDGLVNIARLAFTVGVEVANGSERPTFVRKSGMALPDAMMRRRNRGRGRGEAGGTPRPYLGISLGEADEPGVMIQGTIDGEAAAKAGLLAGDRIVEFGGRSIEDGSDLFGALTKAKVGERVEVTVVRDTKRLVLELVLGSR